MTYFRYADCCLVATAGVSKNEIVLIPSCFLWGPKHGRRSRVRPATTFLDQLERDSGLSRQELPVIMSEKGEREQVIKIGTDTPAAAAAVIVVRKLDEIKTVSYH